MELKDTVPLQFIEAVRAKVTLECLFGLPGELLQVFVHCIPVHTLTLSFERAGLGLVILHAFLVIPDGAIHVINFVSVEPPKVFVFLHPGVGSVLLLLERVENIGAEYALIFVIARLIQRLDLIGVGCGCRVILKLLVEFRSAIV